MRFSIKTLLYLTTTVALLSVIWRQHTEQAYLRVAASEVAHSLRSCVKYEQHMLGADILIWKLEDQQWKKVGKIETGVQTGADKLLYTWSQPDDCQAKRGFLVMANWLDGKPAFDGSSK